MAKRLADFLEADVSTGAAKVFSHANTLLAIARLYRKIVPPSLANGSRVANYKSGVLVIHAANGAVASKLRQMPTILVEKFLEHGVTCTGVRVTVQNRWEMVAPAQHAVVKPLTVSTCEQLSRLSNSLPSSALRRALETLVERAVKKE